MKRRVVFVVYEEFQVLDLVGPYGVFQRAGGYTCEVVAPVPGLVRSATGLPIHVELGLDTPPEGIDTLVVTGGAGVYASRHDTRLTGWVRAASAGARRVTSVCSGAFLLAAAGLLDERRVTTHWARAERLAREYPRVTVDADPIFIECVPRRRAPVPRPPRPRTDPRETV
ncbi:DJ-1/PfpI family protein [Rhizohabitans arisaemae]|uniref:DJ-1/PfpI family protein n=1 Tax=Rhizohabitans arisaemae TaxID=2720610 RepID=UPI0024B215AC|nr:DJ-1/PfpI family protein [Rhizohabitans arisaemae]